MVPTSDVDPLLIRPDDVDDDRWEGQVDDLAAEVTRWIGNDVRPLEFTVAELAHRGSDEPVLRDVLREGVTVAGARGWLAARLAGREDDKASNNTGAARLDHAPSPPPASLALITPRSARTSS
ncbi:MULTISPECIES: hypothetical protein [Actinoalloteichus]|uniref:hypothetical protein n=1 Tax=Actinoalloteichus TaxID=65496 RepID=UPI0009530F6A|nr:MULTISPECIES: hypothetical protein [Actinoalloteichus]